MPKEPLRDVTHLPTDGQVTRQRNVVNLTPNVPQKRRQVERVKSTPAQPTINLSEYQKQLLAEINNRPEVMNLFRMIFQQYPQLVTREFRLSSSSATKRQRQRKKMVVMQRLKMEADIEEQICRLAGIDLNQIQADNVDNPELTEGEVEQAVIEEENTPVDIKDEPEKTTKKKTRKKSSKKTTKKKTNKKAD
jgi:hypothetical protein